MIEVRIDDPTDARLSDYTGLRDPARRGRVEEEGGFFVAEGIFVIERLLASPIPVRSLLLSPSRVDRLRPLVGDGITVFVADRDVMRSIAGFDVHRGALAAADRPAEPTLEEATDGARLIVALERLNDHENLGAILRSAAALGVDVVVMDAECADPWYRRSVRVSMGAVFDIPICRVASLPGALGDLRAAGFAVVAMALTDGATPLSRLKPRDRSVLVLGAEGPGLSNATITAADVVAVIPMRQGIDSLNVGHAAAIAIHHMRSVE